MKKFWLLLAGVCVVSACAQTPPRLAPMAKDSNPSFEVATIKPGNPDRPGHGFVIAGRKFATVNTTLSEILQVTYSLHPKQIAGLPAWAEEIHWEIEGQPDLEGQPSLDQWRIMLKKLLAERFQLNFHMEKRELPVYMLTAAKGGSKIAKTAAEPDNAVATLNLRGPGRFIARNASMANFADLLQTRLLDRPVVEKTGLPSQERYDFELNWQPDASQNGGRWGNVPPSDPPKPDLYTAMPEQLGIRIETTKAPVDVMVVDKVEKPSAN